MAMFLRSISFKIFGVAVSLLLIMVLAAAWSVHTSSQLHRQLVTLAHALIPLTAQLENVDDSTFEIRLLLEQLRSGAIGAENCKTDYKRNVEALGELLRHAEALRTLGSQLAIADKNRLQFARVGPMLDELRHTQGRLAGYGDGMCSDDGSTATAALGIRLREDLDRLRRIAHSATLEMQEFVKTAAEFVERNEKLALKASMGVLAMAALVGLMLAWLISRGLVRPIQRLQAGARSVQMGRLDEAVPVTTRDEIGEVTRTFNTMLVELRAKERIKDTFGQYVDPRIVQSLLEGRADQTSRGEKQIVTVFFSDMVSFTALAERLSPGGLVTLVNEYFSVMSECIRDQNGIVDKYIGDSVMAFWAPPFATAADQARFACTAALLQYRALDPFRARLPDLIGLRKDVPLIDMRVGLASGDAIVGSIGSRYSRSYTVMGDTVNLGSRLEGANKLYGTHILMDQTTRNMAGDAINVREIDSIAVVGKTEPVAVFELLGLQEDPLPSPADLYSGYAAALTAYRQGNFEAAREGFSTCLQLAPADRPAATLHERCELLLRQPPREWDGVWRMHSK